MTDAQMYQRPGASLVYPVTVIGAAPLPVSLASVASIDLARVIYNFWIDQAGKARLLIT